MKRKLVSAFFAAVAATLCLGVAACGDGNTGTGTHVHTAKNYFVDDNSHWKICENCDEKFEEGGHDYDNDCCKICDDFRRFSSGINFSPVTDPRDDDKTIKRVIAYTVKNSGTATDANLIIPTYNLGKPVTAVEDSAFLDCKFIESVILGKRINSIGKNAFRRCVNLETVEFPESLTSIGLHAFNSSALNELALPGSLTELGGWAFMDTPYYLNPHNWEDNTLYNGSALIEVNTQFSGNFAVKEGTKLIADSAFVNCRGISGLTVPDSVTRVGTDAFVNCNNLKSITLGDGLINLNNNLFDDTAFYKNKDNWENGVLYIGKHVVAHNSGYADNSLNLTIKEGTLTIAGGAFHMKNFTQVRIPDSVTHIGRAAFANCDLLSTVNIGKNVKFIGTNAFNCKGIKTINYNGTKEQWDKIDLEKYWHHANYSPVITCTDGKFDKDGNAVS